MFFLVKIEILRKKMKSWIEIFV